jgi:hypothetical protein
VDLDVAADALYALPRDEFTAARDTRVAEARSSGDRALVTQLRRLRRPTVAAWLVNQLARRRPENLAALAALGESLRDAHQRLDGAELRRLSERRREVVTALGRDVRALGEEAGESVSDSVTRELEGMFAAALADPDVARALASGRLSSPRELDEAATLDWPAVAPGARPRPAPASAPAPRAGAEGTLSRAPQHTPEPGAATSPGSGPTGTAPTGTRPTVSAPSAPAPSAPAPSAPAPSAPGPSPAPSAPAPSAPGPSPAPSAPAPSAPAPQAPAPSAPAPSAPAPSAPGLSPALERARRELDRLAETLHQTRERAAAAHQVHDDAAAGETAAHRVVAERRAELIAAEETERQARHRARAARRDAEDAARALREAGRRHALARDRLAALQD